MPKAKRTIGAVLHCISCGCTEDRACHAGHGEGCYWVKKSDKYKIGLCSECNTPINRNLFQGRYNYLKAGLHPSQIHQPVRG